MSIKERLRLSYIFVIAIPIFLSIVMVILIGVYYKGAVERAYSFKYDKKVVERTINNAQETISQLNRECTDNPNLLEDKNYLIYMDKQLKNCSLGFAVRKNNDIVFSSHSFKSSEVFGNIPKFDREISKTNLRTVTRGKYLIILDKNFNFSDKSSGCIYFIINLSMFNKAYSGFKGFSIIVIILIVILAVVFSNYISKGITKPLENLKDAAIKIKNGDLNFKLVNTANDEVGEVFVAFEEMRDRLAKTEELKLQYENNRKELISNISHDLKTPITAIKGYVEGIMDGVADSPEKMDRYIETIYSKANSLDKLIDELFLFSKLDLNKMQFNMEKIDIIKYMNDSAEELKLDLHEKGIEFKYVLENTENALKAGCKIEIFADRDKLSRVIMNIVGNSAKYMNDKDKKIVTLRLKNDEKQVVISVEDNGIGILDKDLPYIFDRFYRADASRNSMTGGNGLGLGISKLIIEGMGGHIWVWSKENKGTKMFFTLNKEDINNNTSNEKKLLIRRANKKDIKRNMKSKGGQA